MPEIKPFLTEKFIQKVCDKNIALNQGNFIQKVKEEVPSDFYEKRKKGENDTFLYQLIRMNDVKEFGVYINRNNLPLDGYVPESIF